MQIVAERNISNKAIRKPKTHAAGVHYATSKLLDLGVTIAPISKSKKGLKDWVCKSTGDWGTRNRRHRSFGAAPEAALAPRGEITLSKSLQRDVRAQKKVLKLEKPEEKHPKGRRRQDDQVLDGW